MNLVHLNLETLEAWKEIDPEGWQKLVGEIVDIFFASAPPTFEELRLACQQSDWDKVKRLSHSLKSSCGNVGADSCHQILNEMEKLAPTEPAAVPARWQALEPKFNAALEELKLYRAKIQAA